MQNKRQFNKCSSQLSTPEIFIDHHYFDTNTATRRSNVHGTQCLKAVLSVPPRVLGHDLPTTAGRLGNAQPSPYAPGWTLTSTPLLLKHICRWNGSAVERTPPFIAFHRGGKGGWWVNILLSFWGDACLRILWETEYLLGYIKCVWRLFYEYLIRFIICGNLNMNQQQRKIDLASCEVTVERIINLSISSSRSILVNAPRAFFCLYKQI